MSEPKTEIKKDDKPDIVADNVGLLKSKIIILERDLAEEKALTIELSSKLAQATAFVEDDKKKMLLAEIRGKVDIPDEILMLKSLDDLTQMKKVLDVARIQVFKSGTPVIYDKKPSPRSMLDNKFGEAQKRRMEAS